MNFFDTLDPKYRLILCDVWGVIHNGAELYPGASQRLRQWRVEGRSVALITNAPRPEAAVQQHLRQLGLANDAYDFVATSGEAGIEALLAADEPVGFIGTADDRAVLEGRRVRIAEGDRFEDLACTGLREDQSDPRNYRAELERLADREVLMHCLNPDRIVVRDGIPEACAGAIADIYQMLGGRVTWYGKPFATIYEHALKRAGNPPKDEVLAVGDGLQTDVLGAARMGIDTVFIAGGIHAGEGFPEGFAEQNGLGDWRPVAVVDGLT